MCDKLLFQTDCLIAGDRYHFVNIIDRATAREVVYRSGHTLQDRTYGFCSGKTLHQFISDIAHFEGGEYESGGFTGYFAAGGFALTYRGYDSGVGLQFSVEKLNMAIRGS